jgi:ring-1,2-phenylacetyl-CoA epoxidase subunit PaaA
VPFLQELDLEAPAHYNEREDTWELEYDAPVAFDAENKDWRYEESIKWSGVMDRWRSRGPANQKHVDLIQSGKLDVGLGSGPQAAD